MSRRPWTGRELAQLKQLVTEGRSAEEVAHILTRTIGAVRCQAHLRGLSWKQHGNPVLIRALLIISNADAAMTAKMLREIATDALNMVREKPEAGE